MSSKQLDSSFRYAAAPGQWNPALPERENPHESFLVWLPPTTKASIDKCELIYAPYACIAYPFQPASLDSVIWPELGPPRTLLSWAVVEPQRMLPSQCTVHGPSFRMQTRPSARRCHSTHCAVWITVKLPSDGKSFRIGNPIEISTRGPHEVSHAPQTPLPSRLLP